jgi:shikimate dehydrogenase
VALVRLGVQEVLVAARNPASASGVVALVERVGATARVVPLEAWASVPTTLVVSTLPPAASAGAGAALVGVDPTGPGTGDARTAWAGAVLLDVVYADWPTPLARAASDAGLEVVSGLDMLVHQAAEQFRLFTGREAPVEAMLVAGRDALGQAGDARSAPDRAAVDDDGAPR